MGGFILQTRGRRMALYVFLLFVVVFINRIKYASCSGKAFYDNVMLCSK